MPKMKIFDQENETPVVGKFYVVKCAKMQFGLKAKPCFIPVIGNIHSDKAFGVNFNHYHIDGRFSSEISTDNGYSNKILMTDDSGNDEYVFHGIEYKRKKCKYVTTGIVPPASATRYHQWVKTFIGKSCKGKKCPHLGTTMQLVDGVLVCPLHNLKGCPTTETIF